MESAKRFAQLLDLGFGDIFLMLGFCELLGDLVKVAKHSFEDFLNAFDLGFGLENPGSLLGRQIAVTAADLFAFALWSASGMWNASAV
jgi:hypothetical protein